MSGTDIEMLIPATLRVAAELERLSHSIRLPRPSEVATRDRAVERNELAKTLRHYRGLRAQMMPRFGLDDVRWNCVLAVYVSETEGTRFTISELALATGFPLTTTSRHVAALIASEVLARLPTNDKRRQELWLSDTARTEIDAYLNVILAVLS